jgi:prepilin-type N-terminal cleavage/methylation domain-containing protein
MARPPDLTSDGGFTLVETLVSIAVIGVVMTSLTAFFTNSLSINNQQRGKQAATQMLDDAMERVRSLKGSGITAERDQASSDNQWSTAPPAVQSYMGDMVEAYDSTAASGSGPTAALPTIPLPVTVNGVTFYENFYIGQCWQPLVGGACAKLSLLATDITLYRVVVQVTWSEKHCPNNGCSMIAATLISGVSTEPLFNSNAIASPPTVTNPGAQVGEVGVPAALTLVSSGGSAPLIWSATGLPANLTMSSAGVVTGTPTTAGSYSVTASSTDAFKLVGSATFTWTVNAVPTLPSPGPQTTAVSDAVSLPLAVTGGTAPYVWTAVGLPTGLTINGSTGAITGAPTLTGAPNVTVTVTDKFLQTATATFKWTVIPKPSITTAVSSYSGTAATALIPLTLAATGGTPGYTWSATGLPTGVTISAAGVISGTPTIGTRFVTVATVTDTLGAKNTKTIVFTVSTPNATYVRITAPLVDRGDAVNASVSVALTAAGGTSPYTWTATGLPPGVALSGATLTGKPTTAGSYVVTVTAKDTANKVATTMFTWTIA